MWFLCRVVSSNFVSGVTAQRALHPMHALIGYRLNHKFSDPSLLDIKGQFRAGGKGVINLEAHDQHQRLFIKDRIDLIISSKARVTNIQTGKVIHVQILDKEKPSIIKYHLLFVRPSWLDLLFPSPSKWYYLHIGKTQQTFPHFVISD